MRTLCRLTTTENQDTGHATIGELLSFWKRSKSTTALNAKLLRDIKVDKKMVLAAVGAISEALSPPIQYSSRRRIAAHVSLDVPAWRARKRLERGRDYIARLAGARFVRKRL